jgi:hypothetical protein
MHLLVIAHKKSSVHGHHIAHKKSSVYGHHIAHKKSSVHGHHIALLHVSAQQNIVRRYFTKMNPKQNISTVAWCKYCVIVAVLLL